MNVWPAPGVAAGEDAGERDLAVAVGHLHAAQVVLVQRAAGVQRVVAAGVAVPQVDRAARERVGADGFEPGRRGRRQVESGNEVVAQLAGNNIARLELVFGVLETDQDKTVLECSMFDRDLSRFERLLHLIERL